MDRYLNTFGTWAEQHKDDPVSNTLPSHITLHQQFLSDLQALTLSTPQGEYARCLLESMASQRITWAQQFELSGDPSLRLPLQEFLKIIAPGTGGDIKLQSKIIGMNSIVLAKSLTAPDAQARLEKECTPKAVSMSEPKSMQALVAQYHTAPFTRDALPAHSSSTDDTPTSTHA